MHGVVVGFGVLLLLTIDGKEEECQKLIAFNKTVGLPAKLSEVGVTVEEVAKATTETTEAPAEEAKKEDKEYLKNKMCLVPL